MIRMLESLTEGNLPCIDGGSEKQINWANSIRDGWIHSAELSLASSYMNLIKEYSAEKLAKPMFIKRWVMKLENLQRQYIADETLLSVAKNAVWWIERRNDNILTDRGGYIPYRYNSKATAIDADMQKAVEQATGYSGSSGNGVGSNYYPGSEKYTRSAQNFAEWLIQSKTALDKVTYEDVERFAE